MNKFKAIAPKTFREDMIRYWMYNENVNREKALSFYSGKEFDGLCESLIGAEREYMIDENIHNPDCLPTCFETEDINFVIPVDILEVV